MRITGLEFILIFLMFFTSTSCVDSSCYDDTESYLAASFSRGINDSPPATLTLIGEGMEETVYNNRSSVNLALFPLIAGGTICRFNITINDTLDIISFHYVSNPYLYSKECGYAFTYELESVTCTNNIIDSVQVIKSSVNLANEENIRIYY